MNYEKLYNKIIEKAISAKRVKSKHNYFEKHHILPKCLGGDNSKLNLVLLTAREHFICHWLLHLMYPKNNLLFFAFHMMCNVKSKNQNRYLSSSRTYEYVKLEKKKRMSGDLNLKYWKDKKRPDMCGKNHPFSKDITLAKKVSEKLKNHIVTDETKIKISIANKGMVAWNKSIKTGSLTDEHKKKISDANKGKIGKVMSHETKEKLRLIQLEKSSSAKKIIQKDKNGVVINIFKSISEAKKKTGFSDRIIDCLKGRKKYYKNFIWEYL
jgi:hypothetical protein